LAHQAEKQKTGPCIRPVIVFLERVCSPRKTATHIRARARNHRGRSRPGWQNRLLSADSFLMRGET
jgi:hypothetical protein